MEPQDTIVPLSDDELDELDTLLTIEGDEGLDEDEEQRRAALQARLAESEAAADALADLPDDAFDEDPETGDVEFDDPDIGAVEEMPLLPVHAGWFVLADDGWAKVRVSHGLGVVSLVDGRKLRRADYTDTEAPAGWGG